MADQTSSSASVLNVAASGMRAQQARMRIIAENMANSDSTATRPGGEPYRRKIVTFRSEVDRTLDAQVVALGRVRPTWPTFANATSLAIRRPTPPAT